MISSLFLMDGVSLTTERAPRRARAILNRLIQTKQLTTSGLHWLVAATDPFHDTQLATDGYPDIATSRSVTQIVTKTITATTPFSTDAEWDCHVFFNPVTPSFVLDPSDNIDPQYYRALMSNAGLVTIPLVPSGLPLVSGVNVCCTVAGSGYQNTTSGTNIESVSIPGTFCVDNWRLIATGYEVVNTTASLYKGGSVTCYRSPAQSATSMVSDTTGSFGIVSLTVLPPNLQSDAALFPDSCTWGAEDGVYIVPRLNNVTNPYVALVPSCAGCVSPPSYTDVVDDTPRLIYVPVSHVNDNGFPDGNTTTIPWDVSGSIFTGLNSNTTLQVTARYIFERVPSVANQDLVVLARPPPSWDPLALEIYSRCMGEMPVGVKVGENPLGEWFSDVLGFIAQYAPTIGGALGTVGVPGAAAIGSLLGTAAKGAGMLMPRKSSPSSGGPSQTANKKKKKRQNAASKRPPVAGPKRRARKAQPSKDLQIDLLKRLAQLQ